MSEFLQRLRKAAGNLWNWFKGLPIILPLYSMLYSRKTLIASAITAFMIEYFPKLAPFENWVDVLVAQIVVISFVWAANILGIAIEDAAEKGNSNGGAVG